MRVASGQRAAEAEGEAEAEAATQLAEQLGGLQERDACWQVWRSDLSHGSLAHLSERLRRAHRERVSGRQTKQFGPAGRRRSSGASSARGSLIWARCWPILGQLARSNGLQESCKQQQAGSKQGATSKQQGATRTHRAQGIRRPQKAVARASCTAHAKRAHKHTQCAAAPAAKSVGKSAGCVWKHSPRSNSNAI